jgi:ribulose-bisphosphate carboxylase large chain
MPVASGGVHAGMIKRLVDIAGTELQIQAGGGVSGHPRGVRGGARAMAQAVDAVMAGVPLDVYAKEHVELAEAIQKWGMA